MTLPSVLADVRARPGMYLPATTYEAAVAFVLGYDAAINGGLLWAFREWLICKVGDGNNLSWPSLVLELVGKTSSSDSRTQLRALDDHRTAIDALFGIISEFLEDRDRANGVRQIYAAYENWLRSQDWYDPSSPDWISISDR